MESGRGNSLRRGMPPANQILFLGGESIDQVHRRFKGFRQDQAADSDGQRHRTQRTGQRHLH